jgi:anti-sigma factor RsiW
MTTCRAAAPLITAYIDGELVGDDRAAFEAHVASCPDCRRLLDEEQGVVATVRASLPLYGAPPPLRQRVEGLLGARPRTRGAPRAAWWTGVGAAAALVAGVAAGVVFLRDRPAGPASEFAALAVDTHLRYARGQLPLEVASDRPETVSRWFEGRIPFRLALPDYPVGPGETKPYHLEGGRLVSFQRDYAAYVAYRMDEQPVSLLVTSADRVRPLGGEIVTSGALRFHVESVAGLNVITWTDKGLTYALASDVAVAGARSCMVCHGSPSERRRLEEFPGPPVI